MQTSVIDRRQRRGRFTSGWVISGSVPDRHCRTDTQCQGIVPGREETAQINHRYALWDADAAGPLLGCHGRRWCHTAVRPRTQRPSPVRMNSRLPPGRLLHTMRERRARAAPAGPPATRPLAARETRAIRQPAHELLSSEGVGNKKCCPGSGLSACPFALIGKGSRPRHKRGERTSSAGCRLCRAPSAPRTAAVDVTADHRAIEGRRRASPVLGQRLRRHTARPNSRSVAASDLGRQEHRALRQSPQRRRGGRGRPLHPQSTGLSGPGLSKLPIGPRFPQASLRTVQIAATFTPPRRRLPMKIFPGARNGS